MKNETSRFGWFVFCLFIVGLCHPLPASGASILPNCVYKIMDHADGANLLDAWIHNRRDLTALSAWADWLREQEDEALRARGELIAARTALIQMVKNAKGRGTIRKQAEEQQKFLEARLRIVAPAHVTWTWGELGLLEEVCINFAEADLHDEKWRKDLFQFLFREAFAANLVFNPSGDNLTATLLDVPELYEAFVPEFYSLMFASGNASIADLFATLNPAIQLTYGDEVRRYREIWTRIYYRTPQIDDLPVESPNLGRFFQSVAMASSGYLNTDQGKRISKYENFFSELRGQRKRGSTAIEELQVLLERPNLFARIRRSGLTAQLKKVVRAHLSKYRNRQTVFRVADLVNLISTIETDRTDVTDLLTFWADTIRDEALTENGSGMIYFYAALAKIESTLGLPPGHYTQALLEKPFSQLPQLFGANELIDEQKLEMAPYYSPLLVRLQDGEVKFVPERLRLMFAMLTRQTEKSIIALIDYRVLSAKTSSEIADRVASQLALTLRNEKDDRAFVALARRVANFLPTQMAHAVVYLAFKKVAETEGCPGRSFAAKALR